MTRLALFALLVLSFNASAIVIRDDVDDSKYRIPASEFPALVDMPGEGHGVLIAPQWIVTAAHAVTWQSEIKQVTLNGISRDVEHLVIHPGYVFAEPTLLRSRRHADATFTKATDGSTVALKDGVITCTWGSFTGKAVSLWATRACFEPVSAPSAFCWERTAPDTVSVVQRWTDADGKAQSYALTLDRVKC